MLVTGAAGLLTLALAVPASAQQPDVTPARVEGETRYHTAANVADLQHDTAEQVVIARGDAFPDALAAAPIARQFDAPILLTETGALPQATRDAIESLGATRASILGGTTAVSQDVAETLENEFGLEVERIHGPDRYHTAAQVARSVQASTGNVANFPGGQRAAFLAFGGAFPDALATGALAASPPNPIPILLTAHEGLSAVTAEAITDLDIELVVIAGGPLAVSEQVEQDLQNLGVEVERVAGQTRQETATELADFGREFLEMDVAQFELTRGDFFADALAVGPYAGEQRNPILLTESPGVLSTTTATYLSRACPDVEVVQAIGGQVAVTTSTLEDAEQAAEQCGTPVGQQELQVAPMQPVDVDPGEDFEFEVFADGDGDLDPDFTTDVTLFPGDAIVSFDGTYRFDDANSDGLADGISSSDTGAATITALNTTDVEDDTHFRDVAVGDDGNVAATVTSDAADDALVVFFVDENNNSGLDIDQDGQALEPWGFSSISWSAS